VLGMRQCVLDQIQELEKTLAPVKRGGDQARLAMATPTRVRAESLIAETRRLLEAITTADRNDAIVLQQRKHNIGREMNQASAAKRVNKTYPAAAYGRRPATMDVQR